MKYSIFLKQFILAEIQCERDIVAEFNNIFHYKILESSEH